MAEEKESANRVGPPVTTEVLSNGESSDGKTEVIVNINRPEGNRVISLLAAAVTILVVAVLLKEYLVDGGDGGGDSSSTGGEGNCGDGLDNDGGGKKDRDDPDCYSNPDMWKGYDSNRKESDPHNDIG